MARPQRLRQAAAAAGHKRPVGLLLALPQELLAAGGMAEHLGEIGYL